MRESGEKCEGKGEGGRTENQNESGEKYEGESEGGRTEDQNESGEKYEGEREKRRQEEGWREEESNGGERGRRGGMREEVRLQDCIQKKIAVCNTVSREEVEREREGVGRRGKRNETGQLTSTSSPSIIAWNGA